VVRNSAFLLFVLFASGVFCGCQNKPTPSALIQHNSRLSWCIARIDAGQIYRDMPVSELKAVFGSHLSQEGLTAKLERVVSADLDDDFLKYEAEGGLKQRGPSWQIDFILDGNDKVIDYRIAKWGEK